MKPCPHGGCMATWWDCPGCDFPSPPLPSPRKRKATPFTPAGHLAHHPPKAVTDRREEFQHGEPASRHTHRAPCQQVHACSLPRGPLWDPAGGDAVRGQRSQHPKACLADPRPALASGCLLELKPETLGGPSSEREQVSLPDVPPHPFTACAGAALPPPALGPNLCSRFPLAELF